MLSKNWFKLKLNYTYSKGNVRIHFQDKLYGLVIQMKKKNTLGLNCKKIGNYFTDVMLLFSSLKQLVLCKQEYEFIFCTCLSYIVET